MGPRLFDEGLKDRRLFDETETETEAETEARWRREGGVNDRAHPSITSNNHRSNEVCTRPTNGVATLPGASTPRGLTMPALSLSIAALHLTSRYATLASGAAS